MSLRSLLSLLLLSVASVSSGGCAVSADRAESEATDEDESAASTGPVFYALRQDFRKCMSPMCGGYFYKRLNKATTNCIGGGAPQEWCYAWNADLTAVNSTTEGEQVLFNGTITTETINGGKWAKFTATAAWKAQTTFTPTEVYGSDPRFYLVKDNGIRCITTPCYSLDAKRINLTYKTTLSGLDLGALTTPDLTDGAVVFGTISTTKSGRIMTGTQVYTQVKRDPNACTADSECTMSVYTRPVTSKSECYCPMCPVPMSGSNAEANRLSYEKYCGALRDSCPIPSCAPRPGNVACMENVCGWNWSID
jgi:hypothetical protein